MTVLNATNPHFEEERRKYHLSDRVRTLKGPNGNQESLVIYRHPLNYGKRSVYLPSEVYPSLRTVNCNPQMGDEKTSILPIRIRRLTPRECERLQGFPDDWTRWGVDERGKKIEISDTQRYKMMGNAVTVPVVEFIARRVG
jgi:site-specific DNA-cytosine methylase